MERLTPQDILHLPINLKEELHRSRKRRAFNVYLSRGLEELSKFAPRRQREIFFEHFGHHAGVAADDTESIDSSDSLYYEMMDEPLLHQYKMKLVCSQWDSIGADEKKAWEERTATINSRILPGAVHSIPGE